MEAEELMKSGDVDGALAALQDAVRSNASDAKLRVFLFQLLCVRGEWDRAVRQLKVSAELDPLATPMAQTYREGIVCELYREKVFAGEKDPLIFGEPQEWIALMVDALKLQAAGEAQKAADTRARAFEAAPTTSGEANGERFEWIADADMRLGPLLEAVVNGKYFWVPFSTIQTISFEEPADLRDVVWTPATMKVATGGEVIALIPTRYAGTAADGGPAEKLARATQWRDLGADTFAGLGQRLLTTEGGDLPLMDLRTLTLDVPDIEPALEGSADSETDNV
ncbi:MAG: type VI secretion system accessory protein TagJ [Pseudomonadota bacterium]